ncbi:MAG: polysaccharide deacetylase family protein [Cytophagales bacterium]|nr:polysaccharide deacetylase family protein [Cytophagales bacterium]
MYYHKTSILLKKLFPSLIWDKYPNKNLVSNRIPPELPGGTGETEKKVIYLTFDDGPVAGVTEWVLQLLKQYNAKATFFCVGKNVEKQPAIFQQIIRQGHSVGNHTYHHLSGWRTPVKEYLADVEKCAALVHSKLFRPPYGTLRPSQYSRLITQYSIIMWDVISGDFDQKLVKEKCLAICIRYTRNGSIIGFHDSVKVEEKLKYVLPQYLKHFSSQGYRFEAL